MRGLAERIVYWIYRLAHGGLSLLPVPVAFLAGGLLGCLAWLALPGYRRLARTNMRTALDPPDGRTRGMVLRHFANLGANLLSAPAIARLSVAGLGRHIDQSALDRIRDVAAGGRGVVLVISHIGNWEGLAKLTALADGIDAAAVYQSLNNKLIDAHVRRERGRERLTLFARRDGFHEPLRYVRDGGVLGVLVDQHAGDHGVWTPLFGRLASTSPLAALLAMRTGAPLVPAAMRTTGFARWTLEVDDPLPCPDRRIEVVTAAINRALERQILRRPEDWFWVHDRWKLPRPRFLLRRYRRGVHVPGDQAGHLKPFRLVIRSSNWLGDAVMSVPAVKAIKRGRSDAWVGILCPRKLADLWRTVPEVDEVIAMEPGDGLAGAVRALRGRGFQAGIVFPHSLRAGLEMWLAGIPRRVGFAGHHRRWTLNQIVPARRAPGPPVHQAREYLRIAGHLGAETSGIDVAVRRGGASADAGVPRIGLCAGAEYGGAKRWPEDRFARVASAVSRRRQCEWVLFGTAGERGLADRIESAADAVVVNRVGRTTLAGLIDELSACRALLTNDTGTMHLATLLGVPVVAIFGSTEPRLTGPLGPGHQVLRHQVECGPCFLRECPLDFRCMDAVTVDEAVEAVLRAISEPVESPAGQTA